MSYTTPITFTELVKRCDLRAQVTTALAEDTGDDGIDITAQLIPLVHHVRAELICREPAILCGTAWFDEVFRQLDAGINISWQHNDSQTLKPDEIVCHLEGPAQPILTGERTAMNFLQTLSGTASVTHKYVNAIAGTATQILDTRKTLPGLRLAQKYAVHCGGGGNHRSGLYDMILIKENHIKAAGSIKQALASALSQSLTAEIEVETLDELQQALATGAKHILLDNMSTTMLMQAVKITNRRATLEASGNINLETIREIAQTGVDYISVGGLTKHLVAVDFSLRIVDNKDI